MPLSVGAGSELLRSNPRDTFRRRQANTSAAAPGGGECSARKRTGLECGRGPSARSIFPETALCFFALTDKVITEKRSARARSSWQTEVGARKLVLQETASTPPRG